MIRIFARRPLLFCALTMCLGMGLVLFGYYNNTNIAFIVGTSLLVSITILGFVLYFFKDKLNNSKRFAIFMYDNKWLWMFMLITYVVGGILCDVKLKSFVDRLDLDTSYFVVGTVESVEDYPNVTYAYLKDVSISNDEKERTLIGKTYIKFKGDVAGEVAKGQRISFYSNEFISKYQSVNKLSSYELVKNIHYTATAVITSDNPIINLKNNKSSADVVHEKVLGHLTKQMPQEIAYLSYSVLFGDTDYLSEITNTSFKISGVAHIVAVSGMNVVFIISILMLCMFFIKRKHLLKFIVITFVLVFYCYLCDYTPSVVRAAIMGLVVLSAKNIGRQGDILSSLGLSCIIILCIWPMSIIDAGFLMSFACVIGIVFFCNPITEFLIKRCKFPKWLASAIAMTVSAQIGIYPIMAQYFNSFSVYSILANIVVVPVFSLAYILLFASLMIVLVMPFMAFTLKLSAIPMAFVYWFPSLFIDLPLASVYVFEMGFATVIYYFVCVFVSSFIFIKDKIHIPLNVVLSLSVVTMMIFSNLPKCYDYNSATQIAKGCCLITTNNNEKILFGVGNKYLAQNYVETIQRMRINELNYVIMFEPNADFYDERETTEFLNTKLSIKQVAINSLRSNAFATSSFKKDGKLICFDVDSPNLQNSKFFALYNGKKLIMSGLDLKEFSVIMLPNNLSNDELLRIRDEIDSRVYLCYSNEEYSTVLWQFKRVKTLNEE